MNIFKTLAKRAKEPSTWAGLSALAMLGGVSIDTATMQALQGIAFAFGGVAAAGAVVIPEKQDANDA